MDLKDIKADFKRCGWKEIMPNKFVLVEATINGEAISATKAQYITHSSVRKLR